MADNESSLHIWNCLTCRRRKVRCDRRWPCSQCSRSGLDCAFPTSGRVPTRRDETPSFSSRDRDRTQGLLARLSRLESMLKHLGVHMQPVMDPARPVDDVNWQATATDTDTAGAAVGQLRNDEDEVTQNIGSMIVSEDDTIYIPSRFWRHISEEVTNLRQSFEAEHQQSSILEGPNAVPGLWSLPWAPFLASNNQPVPFDVNECQPLPSQMTFIWQTYCDNVDWSIKILHRRTMYKILRESKGRLFSLPVSLQALLFAVCLAAISSMSEQDVLDNFNESRASLTHRLSVGAEVSLAKADVLNTTDVRVLQALVIYVEVKSHEAGTRSSWCLTGLVVRIALLMGLHRDGSHFKDISPFNAEMRRRLWWHICFIDARSGELQTTCTQLSTFGIFQDTKPPSNVNDDDLDPQDTSPPATRDGISDASLAIIRYHFWQLSKREKPQWSAMAAKTEAQEPISISPEAIEALAMTRQKIQDSFLRHVEPDNPGHQFLSDIVRQALARSELNLSMQETASITSPLSAFANPGLNRMFILCLAVLEVSNRLEASPATKGWYWALQPPVPWRLLSVLLMQLRKRPWGPMCEQAWTCLNTYLNSSTAFTANYRKDLLWLPVKKLLGDVSDHRQRENKRMQGDDDVIRQLQDLQRPDLPGDADPFSPRNLQIALLDVDKAERQLALETHVSQGGTESAWVSVGSEEDNSLGFPSRIGSSLETNDSMSREGLVSGTSAFEVDISWEELDINSMLCF